MWPKLEVGGRGRSWDSVFQGVRFREERDQRHHLPSPAASDTPAQPGLRAGPGHSHSLVAPSRGGHARICHL